MYPQGDLNELVRAKAALRRNIAGHRANCAEQAAIVTLPLAGIDLLRDLWRQAPLWGRLAAIPLGVISARAVCRTVRPLHRWLDWGSIVFRVWREISRR